MTDLAEFQQRVEQYFQCGQRNEPGGRLILDLMRALRDAHAELRNLRTTNQAMHAETERLTALVILGDQAIAENEKLRAKMERIGELNEAIAAIDSLLARHKP